MDAIPTSFSVWSLFFQADFVVQLVMLSLLGASIWSWAIIFSKSIVFKKMNFMSALFEKSFRDIKDLNRLFEQFCKTPKTPFAKMLRKALKVWHEDVMHKAKLPSYESLWDVLDHPLEKIIAEETEHLTKGLSFLATLSSTGVFIGLFGTVWGIMSGFEAIGLAQNTSLNVVAPAIAEALFATALGLIAVIPASIAYNRFSQTLNQYTHKLVLFKGDIIHLLQSQKFQ